MKSRIFRLGLLVSLAAALAGGLHLRSMGARVGAVGPSMRVGQALDAYLGLDVPPSVWAERRKAADSEYDKCVLAAGLDAEGTRAVTPATYRDTDEMRVADPVRFESLYGYGVALEVRNQLEDSRTAAPAPSVTLPSERDVATLDSCGRTSLAILDSFAAPRAVHQRYAQLLQQTSSDANYAATVGKWSDCLKPLGVVADNPFAMTNVVAKRAYEMSGIDEAGGSMSDAGDTWALDDRQINELQTYELQVFQADSGCRESSGLNATMLQLESRILAELRKEFPSFEGMG